ncbi:MAG: hypothetical protein ACREVN_12380 [Gammaproteobacteria bacterium]
MAAGTFRGLLVEGVIGIQKRDEHVDVEQRPHQYASSSRSRSMISFVTKPPRFRRA